MDKRKTIIVWMDGKKTKVSQNKNVNQTVQHAYKNEEHAATNEDKKELDPIPTYIRQNTFEEEVPFKKSKSPKNKTYKHIFLAAISAILLGVGLGVFMLNMFTNIDTNTVGGVFNQQTETTNGDASNSGEEAIASDLSTYTLKGLQAFVLQAGLFSEESNVTVVQEKYDTAGFPTMVWKRDDNYYLFANVAETKDQTDSKKAKYTELNLETYAKKWTTSEVEIELTETEYKWLQDFHNIWNMSLKNVSKNQSISSTEWNEWIKSYPENVKNTSEFFEKVKSLQTNIDEASETSSPILLLKLWNHYENFVLN
ncbi:hypothetical protein [Virgibacillus necropolis]|uniref:SPOR domain-containing protein n=1 Tax=Virgibacillus necropolis TaxID=163877 RepID=A0A221MBW5_9BACI|nr:hypothetical protein [Virgibacillus necropolis]ASN05099.1 hypothetical protein CFK40_08785 [Virgibacillus necropolis]